MKVRLIREGKRVIQKQKEFNVVRTGPMCIFTFTQTPSRVNAERAILVMFGHP